MGSALAGPFILCLLTILFIRWRIVQFQNLSLGESERQHPFSKCGESRVRAPPPLRPHTHTKYPFYHHWVRPEVLSREILFLSFGGGRQTDKSVPVEDPRATLLLIRAQPAARYDRAGCRSDGWRWWWSWGWSCC